MGKAHVSEAKRVPISTHDRSLLRVFAWRFWVSKTGCPACHEKQAPRVEVCTVVQSGAECIMTSTPSPKNIRLTISVTPEVHEIFQRLAKGSSMSISRTRGDWLRDTADGAEFLALKVEQARSAPSVVMREMQAFALGAADEAGAVVEHLRRKGQEARRAQVAQRGRGGISDLSPPCSNTGGKGTSKPNKGRGKSA